VLSHAYIPFVHTYVCSPEFIPKGPTACDAHTENRFDLSHLTPYLFTRNSAVSIQLPTNSRLRYLLFALLPYNHSVFFADFEGNKSDDHLFESNRKDNVIASQPDYEFVYMLSRV
jgi:hypothetical protein